MTREWFEESFGQDYLLVYKHRDFQGARQEVQRMIGWLGLKPGAEVLDLCCGMGRHSLALADQGYRVTGMDLSEVLLSKARQKDEKQQVRWIHGDMREVPLEQPFDAVVNLFTSFGYFDQETDNSKVIKEISRLLRPDGCFLMDYLNAGYVKEHLVPYSERIEEGIRIEEKRVVEEGFVRKTIRLEEPGKAGRTYKEQVRLYTLADFQEMFDQAGLVLDHIYGDYEAGPYEAALSPRLIMIGRKAGGRR
ncbi:class I SAM-dependent methyltransferase [Paenibacillus senegalensis]|uniref:class I SAM-dependent methyltransferase n=1 Tax=Paenibacillus senegalensis TaxID=1465766 RepID=UPI00028A0CBB|nr:class I SAM-dependent methyltransferase [Paenibacillus senegalensis]